MERKGEPEKNRIKKLEEEFGRKYPGLTVDRSLLRLVGTMSYNHPSKDKDAIHQAVDEFNYYA